MVETVKRIFVAGHRGMVGSAIVRLLKKKGYHSLLLKDSKELDLRNQQATLDFIQANTPDVVIVAAAKVGGILANSTYPYAFLYDNLMMEANLIHASFVAKVPKLIFLGSSCIYPKFAEQPLKEDSLLTGTLEPTNQWYAVAKIAGVKLIEALREQYQRDYVSLMPTNLYGPHDNFDTHTSHVLPAMIRKFNDALPNNPVSLWGSGTPLREFLHVDDLAEAVLFAMTHRLNEHLYNVGYGEDLSIKALAQLVQHTVGHKGEIVWDASKPDGTPRKLMDSSRIRQLGWQPKITLQEGITSTYNWFLQHQSEVKALKMESSI